ncbi:MAG: ATP-binding cassette domain-containing protein [Alphaproteobacteria bacterium]|nr:ATP-binding cassette domain-containing protein [Alphaproteobacteria bacterium]MCB9758196.1 ATP-binding cassette domain-containing protein [Alphaproteobacteria bacterium]
MSRRWLAPEVIQTSAMDCGPAVLKAALGGFGVPAHLGRLREACQTDVDGTSINTLEDLARELGLRPLQTVAPVEHVGIPDVAPLPAIAVTVRPDGSRHFVLLWREVAGRVQVMDPARGRRWASWSELRGELYRHPAQLDAEAFARWARSPVFLGGLATRLVALGIPEDRVGIEITEKLSSPAGLRGLDGAARAAASLQASGALGRGAEAARFVEALAARVAAGEDALLPADSYCLQPVSGGAVVTGAVLLLLEGPEAGARVAPRSEALARALEAPPEAPVRELARLIHSLAPWALPAALGVAAVSALGGVAQAALMRALLDAGRWLQTPSQRGLAIAAMLALVLILGAISWGWGLALARLGRQFELHLRRAFHAKLPRLSDRYFASRLASDLAERAHAIALLRSVPVSSAAALNAMGALLATLAGLSWLDPRLAPLALLSACSAVLLPLLLHPFLASRELRRQTFDGSLARSYLDAMLGATPLRAHGAEESMRREHEGLLTGWRRAGEEALLASVFAATLQGAVGLGLAAWMVHAHLSHAAHGGGALLVVFWSTQLPAQGRGLIDALRALPAMQGVAMRVLEPLSAPEEARGEGEDPEAAARWAAGPLSVQAEGVEVQAGGRSLLRLPTLALAAGEHVAIVGRSGAGKSSLLSLLLGWWRPTAGSLRVGGLELTAERLPLLRRRVAWVDPEVRVWNASLLDNLRYGHEGDLQLDAILEQAELLGVLRALPEGLATPLGEGGGLLSGGQGQRVRLGRAMGAAAPGLVLLDEPFRGLDRGQRRRLLARARARWAEATLLFVTHDVGDTSGFERVWVIEDGAIVEDGAPAELAAAGGPFARMLHEEGEVNALWSRWRRLVLREGQLEEGA